MGAFGLTEAHLAPAEGGPVLTEESAAPLQGLMPPEASPLNDMGAMCLAMLATGGGAAAAANDAFERSICMLPELQACVIRRSVCPLFAITRSVRTHCLSFRHCQCPCVGAVVDWARAR
jgi:hypothetical protein